ncbi:MAG TPA: hypothetical protein H9862_03375 [Candidatus Akkermansia intestinigallinarum]|uniref:Phosphagen kinase C-terminal domain-containing protein n=1 Tax=Candidatus Akkermansia intestinigallinarum TaxID=2838431 RepID=A0A9D2AHP4_9BACT|nr:hypothetical protein [Candidatus Akkermansia intestinigallinarum]
MAALPPLIAKAQKTTVPWLSRIDSEGDIVLGSVLRAVRNLPGFPFPGWSSDESRRLVAEQLSKELSGIRRLGLSRFTDVSELSFDQRRMLLERKLITPCMAARQQGCSIALNRKGNVCVMLNEEEHLVVHMLYGGGHFDEHLRRARELMAEIDGHISFATHEKLGFLTSNPHEAGDGLQLYLMLHLPALALADMTEQVGRACDKLNLQFTPLFGSDDDDESHGFLLCAGPTPVGQSDELFRRAISTAAEIRRKEEMLRIKLIAERPLELCDQVGRSYGQLRYAHRLNYAEFRRLLSVLILGAGLDIVRSDEVTDPPLLMRLLAEGLIELAPGSLALSKVTKESEQDAARAYSLLQMFRHLRFHFCSPYFSSPSDHE